MLSRSPVGSPNTKHVWKFARAGGLDQVRSECVDDFLDIGVLDQKFWVALSCPTRGLHFDERTLGLIDADGTGRSGHGQFRHRTETNGVLGSTVLISIK